MGNLVEFAKLVEGKITDVNREPHWGAGEADRYMDQVAKRRKAFDEHASRLNDQIIQPRLVTLASYFDASQLPAKSTTGCTYLFGYSERFPVSASVEFGVEHDTCFETLAVCYEASMMPAFIKFNEHDRLTLQLDGVNDAHIAEWVEKRLIEFLDAYLRIDRGGDDFQDEAATDPVCGMRICRSSAVAADAYRGHPYFFCSPHCQRTFNRDPTAFVQAKAM